MSERVTPGHPVASAAGYDCMCGECQSLRVTDPTGLAPPPSASEWEEMDPYRCEADWAEVGSL
jgi:hypothetical protein